MSLGIAFDEEAQKRAAFAFKRYEPYESKFPLCVVGESKGEAVREFFDGTYARFKFGEERRFALAQFRRGELTGNGDDTGFHGDTRVYMNGKHTHEAGWGELGHNTANAAAVKSGVRKTGQL